MRTRAVVAALAWASLVCNAATVEESNHQNRAALMNVRLVSEVNCTANPAFLIPPSPKIPIPEIVQVVKSENPTYVLEEVKIIDFVRGEMLYDTRDLRNTDERRKMRERYKLGDLEASMVDRSEGWACVKGQCSAWYPAIQNHVKRRRAALLSMPAEGVFRPREELLSLGVAANEWLAGATITGNTAILDAGVRSTLVFDPAVGNHLISAEFTREGKLLSRVRLSDYRLVDQVWIPFRQEDEGPNVLTATIRRVREAQVNSIPQNLIRIPPEYTRDGPATTRPYGATRPAP